MDAKEPDSGTHGIEVELTFHLERATELAERAKRANTAAQREIDRAMAICDELRGVSAETATRAGALRSHSRDR